jgi:predicted nucleotidyltransferase
MIILDLDKLLQLYKDERDHLLDQITNFLLADRRVVAAWLIGSLGRGTSDALSDLDLWIVINDESIEKVKNERLEFVKAVGEAVLLLDVPQNAPPGGAYMLSLYNSDFGAIQVDWYWEPQSTAVKPLEIHLLFDLIGLPQSNQKPLSQREQLLTPTEQATLLTERVNFFWSMSQIAAKKVARLEIWPALSMLNLVGSTLEEVKWLLGRRNNKPDYTYTAWNAENIPTKPEEQLHLLKRQHLEMENLMAAVVEAGGAISWQLVSKVKEFYTLIEALIKETPK